MTGRGRSTRAGGRAESAAAVSPPRRATRQKPATEDGTAMPPPPAPHAKPARVTRGQSKEAESPRDLPASFGAPELPSSLGDSISSFPTQVTESDEVPDDEAVAEQLRESELAIPERDSQSMLPFGDDGASNYPDSQDRVSVSQQSRRYASTAGGSDAFTTTPGGPRVQARILYRLLDPFAGYAESLEELLYNYTEDEAWELEYRSMIDFFLQARERFQREGYFISEATVISKLDVDPSSSIAYKASRTVAMANLAHLLMDIHNITHGLILRGDMMSTIQGWDESFPMKFLPRREPHLSPWTDEPAVLELALRLRVQRTIYTLEANEGVGELVSLLDAIWIDPKGLTPRQDLLAFLNGNDADRPIELKKTLAGVSLNNRRYTELRNQYVALVRQLYSAIANDHPASAVASLKQDFQLEPLMGELRKWSYILCKQIKDAVPRDSTIPRDSQSVMTSQMDSQSDSQVDPRIFAQPIVRGQAPRNRIPDMAALAELEQIEAQAQAQPQPSLSPGFPADDELIQRRRELMPSSAYPPLSSFEYSQDSPTPAQQNAGIHFAHSAAAAAAGPLARLAAASSTALGKRPANTQESDPFETDDRQPEAERRVEVAETPRPNKRVRRTKAAVQAAAIEGSLTPGRRPPPSASDPDLEALSQRAREVAAANRKKKEPQTRVPWSRNDCRALIRAIDVYKAKWSLIAREVEKDIIKFERKRDQQALRDKARLLKQDLLKTDGVLPPSFDLVVLGKKEKAAVEACGKNPERAEGDLDEDDKPINTEFLPMRQDEEQVDDVVQELIEEQNV